MDKRVPYRLNGVLAVGLIALTLWALLGLPLLALEHSPWWLLTLLPALVLTNTLWFLTHESFHNNFAPHHPGGTANERWGRALAIVFSAPFHVLRFGHMQHHRFNGALVDRPDLYDPETTSAARARAAYWFQFLGGLYLQELASFAIFFLPRERIGQVVGRVLPEGDAASADIKKNALRVFTQPATIAAIRKDAVAAYGLLALSLWAWGSLWFVPMLLLLGRGFLISTANNLPHYGTDCRDRLFGMNLALPAWARLIYLNFYCHRVHHHQTQLPWTELPGAMAAAGEQFDGRLLEAWLAQFRGPMPLQAVLGTGPAPEE